MCVSVVIPVYNSASILTELVGRLEMTFESMNDRYELILVNDGSRDKSWNVICNLAETHKWVHGIDLMRNYGQHNALLCGIRNARFDIIVTMDDDLQHPPEEIPKLLNKLNEGYDVVYGTPDYEQHGILRDIASQLTKIALKTTMGAETARMTSAFRVFRKDIRKAFESYQSPFVSIDVLLTWGTTAFASVIVKHHPRNKGKSNYTFAKLVAHAFSMMTGLSTLPLHIASMLGFFVTLFGLIVLTYVILNFLTHGGIVPGFSFLASIITIFAGTQLIVLGIFGEYLARIHFRTMDRPCFIINEVVDQKEDDNE